MSFYEFIERLQAAGWTCPCDAQWDGARKMYDELCAAPLGPVPLTNRVPAEAIETLREMLPKLVLWGMVAEELIQVMGEAFVAGYREGLADGLLSKDEAERDRMQKYTDDLRLMAASVAASNGQVKN
jgi:hypothetical protein